MSVNKVLLEPRAKPFGFGFDVKDIDAIIAERKDAAKRAKEAVPVSCHGGDRKSSLYNKDEKPVSFGANEVRNRIA